MNNNNDLIISIPDFHYLLNVGYDFILKYKLENELFKLDYSTEIIRFYFVANGKITGARLMIFLTKLTYGNIYVRLSLVDENVDDYVFVYSELDTQTKYYDKYVNKICDFIKNWRTK